MRPDEEIHGPEGYTRIAQLLTLASQQTELSITPTILTPNKLVSIFSGQVDVLKKTDTQVSEKRRYRMEAVSY